MTCPITVHRDPPNGRTRFQDLDDWWARIGRMSGRSWDLACADHLSTPVDVTVIGDVLLLTTELTAACGGLRLEVHSCDRAPGGKVRRRGRVGIALCDEESPHAHYYRLTVPGDVDVDGIRASMLQELVTVRVPLSTAASGLGTSR